MNLQEKKLNAPNINIASKEDALFFLNSLKKQGVSIAYKFNRVVIPHDLTKDKFFVRDYEGQIISEEYGGMGRKTAKNVGEKITKMLNIKSKEDLKKFFIDE